MAKKALVNKANKKPKFAVRGYTRCNRCGRPHAVYRKFGLCRICLREMATPANCPVCRSPAGNRPLQNRCAAGPPRESAQGEPLRGR